MKTSTESTLVCTDNDPVATTTGATGAVGVVVGCAGCVVVAGVGGGTLGQNEIRRMISRITPAPTPARIFCWPVSRCNKLVAATGGAGGAAVGLTRPVGTR